MIDLSSVHFFVKFKNKPNARSHRRKKMRKNDSKSSLINFTRRITTPSREATHYAPSIDLESSTNDDVSPGTLHTSETPGGDKKRSIWYPFSRRIGHHRHHDDLRRSISQTSIANNNNNNHRGGTLMDSPQNDHEASQSNIHDMENSSSEFAASDVIHEKKTIKSRLPQMGTNIDDIRKQDFGFHMYGKVGCVVHYCSTYTNQFCYCRDS
jgi:hypothetical protein